MLILHFGLEEIGKSAVCIFHSSEFVSNFLHVEVDVFELQSSPQLELRNSSSGFCGTRPLRQKCHILAFDCVDG